MTPHPYARLLLLAAGVLLALFAGRDIALLVLVAGLSFLALGQIRLLFTYVLLTAPFLLAATALWTFVAIDLRHPDFSAAIAASWAGEGLPAVVRTVVGTSLAFLALRTFPDGGAFQAFRALGAPPAAALMIAAGFGMMGAVQDALVRSYVGLRAQGIMSPSLASRLKHLPRLLAQTWIGSLGLIAARGDVAWSGNRLLDRLYAVRPEARRPDVTVMVGVLCLSAVVVLLIQGRVGP